MTIKKDGRPVFGVLGHKILFEGNDKLHMSFLFKGHPAGDNQKEDAISIVIAWLTNQCIERNMTLEQLCKLANENFAGMDEKNKIQ